jgi:hypothetical protein
MRQWRAGYARRSRPSPYNGNSGAVPAGTRGHVLLQIGPSEIVRPCPHVRFRAQRRRAPGPHAERASRNSTHPQRYGGRPRKIVENQHGRAYVEMTQVAVFQAAQPQPQQQQPQASAAGSTRTRSSRSSGCGLRLPTGRSAIRPQAAAWIASPTASAGEEGSVIEATLLASASRSPGRGVFRSPRKPSPVTEASRPGIKSARS